ncbi:EamA family transporter [Nocardiopsis lambiniae]|uniref:EamA family transporter n=1 Tax=Nocardiopsis lambiniae TaxID=3075539 RepID=A0ABU2ME52_9ACTN|nr:EamA family transporter [Nocardiopsis sp. DSM 44743]MDT0330968.1 EamA family transporter [Nocardiopsis sp. DSM 44743]
MSAIARGGLSDLLLTTLPPVVWGSTYLVTTELLPPDRPLLAATVRALPAGLALIALGRVLPRGSWWWRSAVLGVLNIGAFFLLLFVAAYHLPGGVAALVMAIQPILVLGLSALLLGDRVRPVQIVAATTAIAGVALLVLRPDAALDTVGVIAGLLGAVSMATGIVLTKRWGRPPGTTLLTFTGWQLTAGGLALLPFLLLVEGLPDRITVGNLTGFAYLSVIGALIAYALWFRGIERLPAPTVSFLSFGSPLAAVLLGYLVLGQALAPLQLVGALAVITAVVLAGRPPRAPAARTPVPTPVR